MYDFISKLRFNLHSYIFHSQDVSAEMYCLRYDPRFGGALVRDEVSVNQLYVRFYLQTALPSIFTLNPPSMIDPPPRGSFDRERGPPCQLCVNMYMNFFFSNDFLDFIV